MDSNLPTETETVPRKRKKKEYIEKNGKDVEDSSTDLQEEEIQSSSETEQKCMYLFMYFPTSVKSC